MYSFMETETRPNTTSLIVAWLWCLPIFLRVATSMGFKIVAFLYPFKGLPCFNTLLSVDQKKKHKNAYVSVRGLVKINITFMKNEGTDVV